ncbi:porin [Mesorhizobium sp. M0854]|uniref:porin n=1 Tax=Mesorhizobium sp. M0854 TaxID=2957013 RepID=UPI003335459E
MNVSSALTLFLMAGYGTDKNIDRNFYKQWGGNWAFWGGATYKLNEKTGDPATNFLFTKARSPVGALTSW